MFSCIAADKQGLAAVTEGHPNNHYGGISARKVLENSDLIVMKNLFSLVKVHIERL